MSIIACTSDCVYQSDGYCTLDRALSCGLPSEADRCVNFIPKSGSAERSAKVLGKD